MTLRRKTLFLILAAIPTLILAAVAIFLLLRFLAVRDLLGTWQVIVHDAKGAEVGHGHLDLVATSWTAHWSWSAPFVDFIPTMDDRAGRVTLDFSAKVLEKIGYHREDPRLINPCLGPGNTGLADVTVELASDSYLMFTVDLNGDRRPPVGQMTYQVWADSRKLPLTVQVNR